jgi:hypothetical protein
MAPPPWRRVRVGAAGAAREGVGAPLPAAERGDVDRITAAATGALGEAAFAAGFARGADADPDELVEAATSAVRSAVTPAAGPAPPVPVGGRDPGLVCGTE